MKAFRFPVLIAASRGDVFQASTLLRKMKHSNTTRPAIKYTEFHAADTTWSDQQVEGIS